MPIDLAGISNENEFYSNHYLTTVLDADLKEHLAAWTAQAIGTSPPDRIASLAPRWISDARDYMRARSMAERVAITRRFARALLEPLGYEVESDTIEDAERRLVPCLARVADADGFDRVLIVEALAPSGEDIADDPLTLSFDGAQFPDGSEIERRRKTEIDRVITKGLLNLDRPPRFVILVSLGQVVLVDRNRWSSRSVMRFHLGEMFQRRAALSFEVMACLLHRELLCPQTGIPLVDRIAEELHRHANAVTTSLKATMREAIEILGNEVIAVTGGSFQGRTIDEKALTLEALRSMYRLLFLFYIEARQDLGFAPLKVAAYRKGYSLEGLRELESVVLKTREDLDGHYLWDSLVLLQRLMFVGTPQLPKQNGERKETRRDFHLDPVRVELLDPEATPLLSSVRLRNEAIQKIIRLLSLSRGGKGSRPGRISYAQLGIAQLGAVYETLLSFTGFIARQDLIEVRPPPGKKAAAALEESEEAESADEEVGDEEEGNEVPTAQTDKVDPLAPAWFVPASRASEFTREEILYIGPNPRIYSKGTFVYRLAGRDRQASASYYTPEPLARLLVKHALMDLTESKKSEEILKLRILEPAMGSAAFLVETTNQLAELYLERKQKEIGRVIPQESFAAERQRVRAYIADRNCFGVDLNPVAVELGQISMWLNCLHTGGSAPWFGDQLHAGNSLVGARRAAYPMDALRKRKGEDLWLKRKPIEIGWSKSRAAGHVWHFLLPDEGMVAYAGDKSIAGLAEKAKETVKAWRMGGFFAPFEAHEIKGLEHLSSVVDQLFEEAAEALDAQRVETNDEIMIWPETVKRGARGIDYREKKRIYGRGCAELGGNSLPFQRLKTAMDVWCALWFWPLDEVDELPDRSQWLLGLNLILKGGMAADGSVKNTGAEGLTPVQGALFETVSAASTSLDGQLFTLKDQPRKAPRLFSETSIETLVETYPWLKTARAIAERQRFVHFDLIFADVMRERGGFDLVIGNPPWMKPEWNDNDVLGDMDPQFMVKGWSAKDTADRKKAFLEAVADRVERYLNAYVSRNGLMGFTGSQTTNPFIGAGQNNFYKCFIDLAFRLTARGGRAGLIHQDNHLVDPKAGVFRRAWYRRVKKHFNFRNQIQEKMFPDVAHRALFSANVYAGFESDPLYDHVAGAFLVSQVEDSFLHDGSGEVPGIKRDARNWDLRGHRKKIIRVDQSILEIMRDLVEEKTTPFDKTRFLLPHSQDTLSIFRAMSEGTIGFAEGAGEFMMNGIWDEFGAQKDLGVIARDTRYPGRVKDVILTGPIFYVGNPLYKTPNCGYQTKADYEVVDLSMAPDEYLPRTIYQRVVGELDYRRQMTSCRWDPTCTHAEQYRIAFRRRLPPQNERTLIGALVPPGIAHVNSVESLAFRDEAKLVASYPAWVSLPLDFLVKSTGLTDFREASLRNFPWVDIADTAKHRALRLGCLTTPDADLWNRHAGTLSVLPWSSEDPRLALEGPVEGPMTWDRTAGLRSDFARRLALVEIDVLVGQALGLTFDQLVEMYRIHFPVLKQNEEGTWYDQSGRIVWTCSKGLPGVGYLDDRGKSPARTVWDAGPANMTSGELVCAAKIDFLPGGPHIVERRFQAPFTRCDRIADYRRAWAYFERLDASGRVAA